MTGNIIHMPKDSFQDSMRPLLREYYNSKISFLRNVLQEIIPESLSPEFLDTGLGRDTDFPDIKSFNEALFKPMRQYIRVGGKLFRPMITTLFMEGYGKDPRQFKSIVAISEIIHSCSLILDDIADSSKIRRGSPCSHLIYGVPRAANASSAMTFFTFRLLQNDLVDEDPQIILKLYETLLWEHYITSVGSALDLGWSGDKNNNIGDDEYVQHILFRSSSYTYRHAARLGAIIGGADDSDLDSIFQYGSNIGVAFQFIDDILNLKPQSDSWGKTPGEDITEGKRTPLVLHTLRFSDKRDRSRLLHILDNRVSDPAAIEEAINLMEKYDAFSAVRNSASEYTMKARENIKNIRIKEEYRELLYDLTWHVVERDT
jgi:geranylgeranyl pyrophosphate synthase